MTNKTQQSAATDVSTGAPATNATDTTDTTDATSKGIFAGALVSALREGLKMSRAELAAKIGVSEMAIGQYERGDRTPSIKTICAIADFFSLSVDELVGRDISNYDSVKKYRYENAIDFCRTLGYQVSEFTDDQSNTSVLIWRGIIDLPKFTANNSVISVSGRQQIIDKTKFQSKYAFVAFVESIMWSFLTAVSADEIFSEALFKLKTNDPYLPNLKIARIPNSFVRGNIARGSIVSF